MVLKIKPNATLDQDEDAKSQASDSASDSTLFPDDWSI